MRARDLGARPHNYGVRPDHYEVAEPAVLAGLAVAIGPDWTAPTMVAWRRLYRLIVETMLEGAAGAAFVGPPKDGPQAGAAFAGPATGRPPSGLCGATDATGGMDGGFCGAPEAPVRARRPSRRDRSDVSTYQGPSAEA
jgi:hypothetical protein